MVPVTPEGRAVAVVLMVAGVGLFGTLSGFLATWFPAPGRREQESEVAGLRAEIQLLRAALERAVPGVKEHAHQPPSREPES